MKVCKRTMWGRAQKGYELDYNADESGEKIDEAGQLQIRNKELTKQIDDSHQRAAHILHVVRLITLLVMEKCSLFTKNCQKRILLSEHNKFNNSHFHLNTQAEVGQRSQSYWKK